MAITKERKNEMVNQYSEWLSNSKALVVAQYTGMSMKELDALRSKVREVGGEFHVLKNTLAILSFQKAGLKVPEKAFEGSTAVAFAIQDAPALAKTMTEFAKSSEFLKIKAGYLEKEPITVDGVKALADLPPLPVMRAQLLGTIMAPASQLVRLLAEPGRQIAAVIKAKYEPAESTAA